MSKNGIKKIKGLVRGIKKLEFGLPKEADSKYFADLEGRIMKELDSSCKDVRESLVDFCEGSLDKMRMSQIQAHIDSCKDCQEEYKLTVGLIAGTAKVDTREETVDDYFATLADRITEKAFEGTSTNICDTAQDFIINMYTEEPIPAEIKKHFETCASCKTEMQKTERLVSNLKKLSVPLPNEQYFEEQLKKIDAAIEAIPSRVAISESRERITSYISGILDTFRATIMQPQAAIAVSALVALLIIGGKLYYSQDSIEERQINLSEVMNKTNAVATGVGTPKGIDDDNATKIQTDTATAARQKYMKEEGISDPKEDEALELKTTGTAEVKKGRTKKVN